ncbi:MAG: peptidoglycan DD-metalloendopeptidase family protein [Candidatus Kerfeldbacteria bacterium]|nr:peptidoglycan DD-metalloendopeptidase family protein [Candidatus Kerfeldbacteria bacterium]
MALYGNIKKNHYLVVLGVLTIVLVGFFGWSWNSFAQTAGDNQSDESVTALNAEIDAKRKEVEELNKRAQIYEDTVKAKQKEASTLQNQLSLIDVQVEQTQNDIERITAEIEALNLELEQLAVNIADKTVELQSSQEVLAQYLRLIHRYDQQTYLEILMTNKSFSEFFDNFQYTQKLQADVEQALVATRTMRDELALQEKEKSDKKSELSQLSDKLTGSVADLGNQKDYKTTLLADTKEDEATYQVLLAEAKREQDSAQADIRSLESKARSQLEEEGVDLSADTQLIWPVAPLKGISAYFHDPSYPFRHIFEHPAIDIPAPQGTPIRAADNGYVVRAKNAGMGYSYIMLVHNDQFTTVYGHVSRIDVTEEEYVVRGQQIGLVGGLPGTPGAGGLTTGPHLHFEVRSNGIPVNPLDYLPGY